MEPVSGQKLGRYTLTRRLGAGGMAEVWEATDELLKRRVAVKIVRGGVVHRDVKPLNVLFDETGAPHLSDFGLARGLDETTHLTQTGMILGTPLDMSPEQAMGTPAGPAADQYSLGIVAYRLLAGRLPFEKEPTPVLLRRTAFEEMPPPSNIRPAAAGDRLADVPRRSCPADMRVRDAWVEVEKMGSHTLVFRFTESLEGREESIGFFGTLTVPSRGDAPLLPGARIPLRLLCEGLDSSRAECRVPPPGRHLRAPGAPARRRGPGDRPRRPRARRAQEAHRGPVALTGQEVSPSRAPRPRPRPSASRPPPRAVRRPTRCRDRARRRASG